MEEFNLLDKILFGLHSVVSIIITFFGIYIIAALLATILGVWVLLLMAPWILLEFYKAYKFKKFGYIANFGGYIKNNKKNE